MALVPILVVLVIMGFMLFLIMQISMPPVWKNIILGVAILFVVLWLLQTFGLMGSINSLRIK